MFREPAFQARYRLARRYAFARNYNLLVFRRTDSRAVPAVNVSARYAALEPDTNSAATVVHVRLRETENGARLPAIVEMTRDLAKPALVLLDEVGAGTDPTEGGALGVAIVEHFRRIHPRKNREWRPA